MLRQHGSSPALLKQPVHPRLACSPLGSARPSFLPIFFQGYNQDAVRREIVPENLRWNRRKISPMTQTDVSATTPANHPTDQDLSAGTPANHPTDQTRSAEIKATALATLLAQAVTPPEPVAYRGVLTPRELDAPARETAALVSAAAVHDLGWLRRVAVRGEDRFRWLSGMVTNMVKDLGENAGTWNLVLNAQGRIQGDLYVWREGERLDLEIAADQYDKLLAHLEHFIIMDDVELAPRSVPAGEESSFETALGLTGPLAAGVLARLGLPAPTEPLTTARGVWNGHEVRVVRGYGLLTPHFELWVEAAAIPALWPALTEAGSVPVGAASLEALRIAEAIPAYGIDIAERDLAQETSQMRALHFSKGCYLGQEIVERIRSRGSVHRHLRPLELFGPVPVAGTELTLDGGANAGHITSAAELPLAAGSRLFALGMIRGEAELHNQPFTYTAGTATGTARILAGPPELCTN
jgi:folate-binding protein YgfZ